MSSSRTSPDSRAEQLTRIQDNMERLLEETAYQRAKLEEVHARTADIPAMVQDTHNLRRRLFQLGGGVIGLFAIEIARWWDVIQKLWG